MHLITTPEGEIRFVLERTKRRTVSINIRRDGSVIVRAPLKIPVSEIESFVRAKAKWILKHSKRLTERHVCETKDYTDGELHYYLGRPIPLRIKRTGRNRISLTEESIEIETANEWNPGYGEQLVKVLYRKKAMEVFGERMAHLLKKHSHYNFRPTGLKVRSTVSRWGSCSPNGSINLSSNLLKKRIELIDYVIMHELCHLRHRNHGPGFYKLLEEVCPDYRLLKAELKSGV
ncbi:MAG: SprT family zinc-dependent metalloprotease [Bacteroidales bacterium]